MPLGHDKHNWLVFLESVSRFEPAWLETSVMFIQLWWKGFQLAWLGSLPSLTLTVCLNAPVHTSWFQNNNTSCKYLSELIKTCQLTMAYIGVLLQLLQNKYLKQEDLSLLFCIFKHNQIFILWTAVFSMIITHHLCLCSCWNQTTVETAPGQDTDPWTWNPSFVRWGALLEWELASV